MTNESLHRMMTKLWSVLLLLSVLISPSTPGSILAASSIPTALVPATSAPPTSINLHGWVKDQLGNPIQSAISVIDRQWTQLGYVQTDANGIYTVTVDGRDSLSVTATPVDLPENLIVMEGGYFVSKYFELTNTIVPTSEDIEMNFELPPAAVLWIVAYSPEGDKMKFNEFNAHINPPDFYGYQGVYGAFPMDSFSLPIPTGASIGMLRAAWHPEKDRSQWESCFSIPPGEAVYLMMLWEVPGIGSFPLRADHEGQGYNLAEDQVVLVNLVYEFAETEYRRATELKTSYEAQGYQFTPEVVDWFEQANGYLDEARNQADEKSQALLSYEVLKLSFKAREQMTLEVSEKSIEARKDQLAVVVLDEAGNPVPEANVNYSQSSFDFMLGSVGEMPKGNFNYLNYKASKEMGFEYLSELSFWKKVSPEEGVYDFTILDGAFERAKVENWKTMSGLVWLGSENYPTWAEAMDFSEFKQNLREFVMKSVENLRGKVKYLNVAGEITIQTHGGSRYVNLEFESNYATGVQPAELIELLKTAFDAAREVDSGILLGYAVDPDYGYSRLNPGNFGAWPTPYSFLKSALESGVRPDYIGVEFYPNTGNLPIDLSTLAASIQAYHDLSGLPVLLTEFAGYSSRTEDYGLTGPTPDVYWHEGLTQKAQADWDTSVFKIAMGLPYVNGLQLVHGGIDYPGWETAPPGVDCIGIPSCFAIGMDFLNKDYEPKQVYYDLQALFDSWKAKGSAATDAYGKASFKGLGGTYSIGVTTAEGLLQTFETHLGPESKVVTVRLDRAKAIADLQHLVTEAQKGIDWSQNLGRQLDYINLRSRLAEARNAMAVGDYGSARIITELIVDAITIKIDGNPDDWKGIPPIATAPPGGVAVDAPGIDLKALYGMRDDQFLYLMVEVYDPPITLQPGGILGGIYFPRFIFFLNADTEEQYGLGIYLPYTGQMDVTSMSRSQVFATLYTLAYGNVLELRVPLALLDNPSRLSVCAFVTAAEDGEEKGAKAFECYVDVLSPVYAVYLPLVVRE